MKHLRIEYNGIVMFDGELAEFQLSESNGSISVTGREPGATGPLPSQPGSGGNAISTLADILLNASKQKTQQRMTQLSEQPAPLPEPTRVSYTPPAETSAPYNNL